MAQQESNFQARVMGTLDALIEQLEENKAMRDRTVSAFERLVAGIEAQNKYYCC